jgi:hypothetical protein
LDLKFRGYLRIHGAFYVHFVQIVKGAGGNDVGFLGRQGRKIHFVRFGSKGKGEVVKAFEETENLYDRL